MLISQKTANSTRFSTHNKKVYNLGVMSIAFSNSDFQGNQRKLVTLDFTLLGSLFLKQQHIQFDYKIIQVTTDSFKISYHMSFKPSLQIVPQLHNLKNHHNRMELESKLKGMTK